jgi:sortase (surface protein transpeptidase)
MLCLFFNTTRHDTTRHDTAQHNTAQNNTAQHKTKQHNTAQNSTAQHNPAQTYLEDTASVLSARVYSLSTVKEPSLPVSNDRLANSDSGALPRSTLMGIDDLD